jgi:hypothetical protein
VIIEAKRSKYNERILTSQNKLKTARVIVKYETGQGKDIAKINNSENDYEIFTNYFLRIAERNAKNHFQFW